jgi:hypothetical protein
MGDVSEDQLTARASFIRSKDANFAESDATPAPNLGHVCPRAAGLYPQNEAGQSCVPDFERILSGLRRIARQQPGSYDGTNMQPSNWLKSRMRGWNMSTYKCKVNKSTSFLGVSRQCV